MDKGKPIGVLECGDLFKTRATRRWGKMYGNAPGVGSAVKIAAKLEDVPATPLRWLDPHVLVDPIGYVLAVLALSVLSACGGSNAVTGPSPESTAPAPVRMAYLPGTVYGAFAESADVREAGANAGNVVLIVPSYVDDAARVADALQATGKVGILSAHHVFGNARATWDKDWPRLKEWAAPLLERSLIAAVLVVDEPLHNGIPASTRDEAIAIVRRDGFRILQTEWVDQAVTSSRPPADLYGVTCYYWSGVGSWSMDRCMEAYRTNPSWNLVIGQGWDVLDRGTPAGSRQYTGTVEEQVRRWAEMGKARSGVLFWVWRWPGQTGIGDDPVLRSAYNREGWR